MTITPKVIEYGVILALVSVLLSVVYYKGYSDASSKHEKDILVALVESNNRLNKVEGLSSGIADLIAATSGSTTKKLDSILSKSKDKPLTSVPCTPSQDFVTSWNELNKVTK